MREGFLKSSNLELYDVFLINKLLLCLVNASDDFSLCAAFLILYLFIYSPI